MQQIGNRGTVVRVYFAKVGGGIGILLPIKYILFFLIYCLLFEFVLAG